jgi:hypothetical protein
MSTLELDKLQDFGQQKEHIGCQKLFAIDIKELNQFENLDRLSDYHFINSFENNVRELLHTGRYTDNNCVQALIEIKD